MATFAQRLKMLREKNNLLQKELAEKFGVKRSTIASWEIDSRSPDLNTLKQIADFFNVSVDYLLGRSDNQGNYEGVYISPDDLKHIPIEKRTELGKYVKYFMAIDEASAAGMTPDDVELLIKIAKGINENKK